MNTHALDRLYTVVAGRKHGDPGQSYTARLFAEGRTRIAQKLGEEAVETALAAVTEGHAPVVNESADLLYHLTVLWVEVGIVPGEVWHELERRFGLSGLEEKNRRSESR